MNIFKAFLVAVIISLSSPSAQGSHHITDTYLHDAIVKGDLETVQSILSRGYDLNVPMDTVNKYTPLVFAVKHQQYQIAELMISKGAKVNKKDRTGETPLFFPVRTGDDKMLAILLKHKGDPNATDDIGVPLIYLAAFTGHPKVVNLLIKHGANVNKVSGATVISHGGGMTMWKGKKPDTALNIAKTMGYDNVVSILKKAGAKK